MMGRLFKEIRDNLDSECGRMADGGFVGEAWKIRGFIDGLFLSEPLESRDANYMIGFAAGTAADDL